MTINRNNFEAFLLDYLEGNLDPLLTADLMAFLAENPEYENYIRDFHNPDLPDEPLLFPDKSLLKKDFSDITEINPQNFDEFCIAASENILHPTGMEKLMAYIGHDAERMAVYTTYSKMKLQPDLSIRYKDYNHLKKSIVFSRKKYIYYALSAAAVITFILFLSIKEKPVPVNTMITQQTPGINVVTVPADDSLSVTLPPESIMVIPVTVVKESRSDTLSDKNKAEIPPKITPLSVSTLDNHYISVITLRERNKPIQKNTDLLETTYNNSENILAGLIAKVDFWKTAETAINSFNYLTESQISIHKTTDVTGRTTGLSVDTERYSIEGNKVK